MINKLNILDIVKIAIKAGDQVMEVYHSDFAVEAKEDKSPLTLADKKSHEVIKSELSTRYPQIPVLSEEGEEDPYSGRKDWEYSWLVDPLDGTKEFVKRNGEFTVNIALIHRGKAILGVIYAPVLNTVYYAKEKLGSFKLDNVKQVELDSERELTKHSVQLPVNHKKEKMTAVASRSHMSPETEEYMNKIKSKYGEVEIISAGSSLKLCLVAEGKADVYPRFAPTMEWDTGAGQAIIEQSGGSVVQVENNESVHYNKENLLNPWFIAKAKGFK